MANFDVFKIDIPTVIKLLDQEQILRYSDQVQDMYNQKLNDHDDPEYIEKWVQRKVLNDNGYSVTNHSLKNYQSIAYHFGHIPEVKNAIQYMRINIIKDCPIKIGDKYTDCKLMTINKKDTYLSKYYKNSKPLVILAGSIT